MSSAPPPPQPIDLQPLPVQQTGPLPLIPVYLAPIHPASTTSSTRINNNTNTNTNSTNPLLPFLPSTATGAAAALIGPAAYITATTVPRGSNASLRYREEQRALASHHSNLKQAKSVLNTWNRTHFALKQAHQTNIAGSRVHRETQARIAADNARIVDRITDAVVQVSTKHSNNNIHNRHNINNTARQSLLAAAKTLHSQKRIAELDRIQRENLLLASRIINKRATYQNQEFRKHAAAHEKNLINLSKYEHIQLPSNNQQNEYKESLLSGAVSSRSVLPIIHNTNNSTNKQQQQQQQWNNRISVNTGTGSGASTARTHNNEKSQSSHQQHHQQSNSSINTAAAAAAAAQLIDEKQQHQQQQQQHYGSHIENKPVNITIAPTPIYQQQSNTSNNNNNNNNNNNSTDSNSTLLIQPAVIPAVKITKKSTTNSTGNNNNNSIQNGANEFQPGYTYFQCKLTAGNDNNSTIINYYLCSSNNNSLTISQYLTGPIDNGKNSNNTAVNLITEQPTAFRLLPASNGEYYYILDYHNNYLSCSDLSGELLLVSEPTVELSTEELIRKNKNSPQFRSCLWKLPNNSNNANNNASIGDIQSNTGFCLTIDSGNGNKLLTQKLTVTNSNKKFHRNWNIITSSINSNINNKTAANNTSTNTNSTTASTSTEQKSTK